MGASLGRRPYRSGTRLLQRSHAGHADGPSELSGSRSLKAARKTRGTSANGLRMLLRAVPSCVLRFECQQRQADVAFAERGVEQVAVPACQFQAGFGGAQRIARV